MPPRCAFLCNLVLGTCSAEKTASTTSRKKPTSVNWWAWFNLCSACLAYLNCNVDTQRNDEQLAIIQVKGCTLTKLLLESVLLRGFCHSCLCNLGATLAGRPRFFATAFGAAAFFAAVCFFAAGAFAIISRLPCLFLQYLLYIALTVNFFNAS